MHASAVPGQQEDVSDGDEGVSEEDDDAEEKGQRQSAGMMMPSLGSQYAGEEEFRSENEEEE